MVALAEFSTPQIDIGEYVYVLAGDARSNGSFANTQGRFILANNTYNQSDYPELYARIGIVGGSPFTSQNSTLTYTTDLTYGNGLYIASGASGQLSTSTDAITWTSRTTGTSSNIYSLTYGNGLYVFVGWVGMLFTSTDGITWTSRTSGTSSILYSATYGNGIYVYGGATGALGSSTDGITWTARTSGSTSSLYALTYGNGLYIYGAVGGGISTSTDAITWTARTSGTTSTLYALEYGNGIYIAGGQNGVLRRSTDGITWSSVSSTLTKTVWSITFGNNLFIAATTNNVIATSSDGIVWTEQPMYTANRVDWLCTTYGSGKYVVAGGNTNLATSNTANTIEYTPYDRSTLFYLPDYTSNTTLLLTTYGLNSSPQYVTYVRAK